MQGFGAILLCCATGVHSVCQLEKGVQQIDFNASVSEMKMRDSAGAETDRPFPNGGSIRFTRIGQLDGRVFDLLVRLHNGSMFTYVHPEGTVQGNHVGGFACLGVGIMPTSCTNGGTLNHETATCIGEESYQKVHGASFDFTFVETGTEQPVEIEKFVVTFCSQPLHSNPVCSDFRTTVCFLLWVLCLGVRHVQSVKEQSDLWGALHPGVWQMISMVISSQAVEAHCSRWLPWVFPMMTTRVRPPSRHTRRRRTSMSTCSLPSLVIAALHWGSGRKRTTRSPPSHRTT